MKAKENIWNDEWLVGKPNYFNTIDASSSRLEVQRDDFVPRM